MYGALELAERLRLHGGGALPPATTLRGAPALPIRAANMFWTLPDPDQPETEWWFHDEQVLARLPRPARARAPGPARHPRHVRPGDDQFPNLLVQLARSATFPDVGVPAAERERNHGDARPRDRDGARARHPRRTDDLLPRRRRVFARPRCPTRTSRSTCARRRSISRRARQSWRCWGSGSGRAARAPPGTSMTIVAATRAAATGVTAYTRSWVSSKPEIVALATAVGRRHGAGSEVQRRAALGPPYPIAGGAMTTWESYSYQSYLNPPAPWQFVSQVRAAGTHRIFRQASFARTPARDGVARALAAGSRLHAGAADRLHAPARFLSCERQDRFLPWAFARDDLMYLLWGRLGYDPGTPESTFRDIAAREAGTDGLWPAVQAASDIVPWIQTGHTCGPDHRLFAPELELGGNVAEWARAFDPSISESAGCYEPVHVRHVCGRVGGRDGGRPGRRFRPPAGCRRSTSRQRFWPTWSERPGGAGRGGSGRDPRQSPRPRHGAREPGAG